MDYLAFYRQMGNADKELLDICYSFNELRLRTSDFAFRLEGLAMEVEKIDSQKEREMFNNVLTSFSERLYEISERCDNLSGELDEAHHNNFVAMLSKAEEMAMKGRKKAV